jgi:hypothetical protein
VIGYLELGQVKKRWPLELLILLVEIVFELCLIILVFSLPWDEEDLEEDKGCLGWTIISRLS